MKNNLLSEKLVYTGDTRTPTHLHLVRYTPDEVHEYTADSLPPIEPQFSEKGMIWLQVHGLKETETVRQVCDRFGLTRASSPAHTISCSALKSLTLSVRRPNVHLRFATAVIRKFYGRCSPMMRSKCSSPTILRAPST